MTRKWKRANERKLKQNKRRVELRTQANLARTAKPVRAQSPLVSKPKRPTIVQRVLHALTRKG
jgi:hypothetical protein